MTLEPDQNTSCCFLNRVRFFAFFMNQRRPTRRKRILKKKRTRRGGGEVTSPIDSFRNRRFDAEATASFPGRDRLGGHYFGLVGALRFRLRGSSNAGFLCFLTVR